MILLTPSTHEQAKQEVQEANGGVGVQGSEEGEEEVSRCRRKETEIERNKNESQETRNKLKVSDLETYPLKNDEWMKNDE